jgi:hypothetical protein
MDKFVWRRLIVEFLGASPSDSLATSMTCKIARAVYTEHWHEEFCVQYMCDVCHESGGWHVRAKNAELPLEGGRLLVCHDHLRPLQFLIRRCDLWSRIQGPGVVW